ncbi:AAA ATPase [Entomophthora muscae]|uniref:AAA ATPase n=1 Tax=Entomophthora muscae TaxID=34485 RepID=A0ACC2U6V0_9FUNG|nr:AAA ATPase [Entomophthora muscae]
MAYSLRERVPRAANKPSVYVDDSPKAPKRQKVKAVSKKVPRGLVDEAPLDTIDSLAADEQIKQLSASKKAAAKPKATNKIAALDVSNLSLYFLASRQLDRGSDNAFTEESSDSNSNESEIKDEGMAGRDEEKKQLGEFWEKHVTRKVPGSLYISGQPGTGKTALLKEWMVKYHSKRGSAGNGATLVVHFNCVAVTGPRAFLPALLDAIPIKSKATFEEPIESLKLLITTSSGFIVLILDELDHLLGSVGSGAGQEILYQVFELVHLPGSRISVIGVANDLNLTDRFLPRLRARGYEPQRIKFQPYNLEQIKAILTKLLSPVEKEASRRCDLSGQPPKLFFNPAALEFCARKVASVSGDLRRALDLCRQAVNIAESEASAGPMIQISVGHILKAEQASAGSPVIKTIKALPPNAQVLLAAILHLIHKNAPLIISQLYEEYFRVCNDSGLFEALSINEVGALLDNLETNGLISRNLESKAFRGTPVRRPGPNSEADLRKALMASDLVRTLVPCEKKKIRN